MKCLDCNSDMLGDGVTSPLHCEFIAVDPWVEPDADPVFCGAVPIPKPDRFKALQAVLKNEYSDDYGTYPDSIMRLLEFYERYDLLMLNSCDVDHDRMGNVRPQRRARLEAIPSQLMESRLANL